jgi:hypothetical protein
VLYESGELDPAVMSQNSQVPPTLRRVLARKLWLMAHESRSIDQLVSLISSDNVRSQRVAERLGAVPTETYTPLETRRKTVVLRHPPAR